MPPSPDSKVNVKIFSSTRGTTRITARKGPQVVLKRVHVIAVDVTAEIKTAQSTYIIEVTKSEEPPSGGPLPQPQSFQPSAISSANQLELASSSAGLGEWKSHLIFAELLLDGGVRFVFAVPAEESGVKETADLLGGHCRRLPDDEVKILRLQRRPRSINHNSSKCGRESTIPASVGATVAEKGFESGISSRQGYSFSFFFCF